MRFKILFTTIMLSFAIFIAKAQIQFLTIEHKVLNQIHVLEDDQMVR
jgi:hypothetical protein